MAYDNNEKRADSVYSQRVRAGKRRTYFFDVRETRGNDYYLTITESRKKFNEDGYDRHKIFLYKEDFNKFLKGITEAIDYVKTELMPDFDFDVFSHENDDYQPRASKQEDTSSDTSDKSDASDSLDSPDSPKNTAVDTTPNSTNEPEQKAEEPSAHDADSSENNNDTSHHDEQVDKW